MCIRDRLNPDLAKAWFRLATAELKRKRGMAALVAARQCGDLDDGDAVKRLIRDCEALRKQQKKKELNLYGDRVAPPKRSASAAETEARDATLALQRLRRLARDAADGRAAALRATRGQERRGALRGLPPRSRRSDHVSS